MLNVSFFSESFVVFDLSSQWATSCPDYTGFDKGFKLPVVSPTTLLANNWVHKKIMQSVNILSPSK